MPRARIIRDMKARATVASSEVVRQAFRYLTHNTALPAKVRAQAQLQLNAFPRDARPTAIHNRCLETGRGRGVLRAFRLCRFQFRLKALEGELPGVRKSTCLDLRTNPRPLSQHIRQPQTPTKQHIQPQGRGAEGSTPPFTTVYTNIFDHIPLPTTHLD
ncbi:40S ribosomal protein mrp2, mitochondrial [Mortierella sp. AD032]|nr:40S ribosomal protein mrp2, mitochondrial [Mortierella sp. AD032]